MGTLHVVATPIGNLEDVTLRALRVLGEADWVYAEDTRRTRILLDRHHLSARLVSLHAHNESARIAAALEHLGKGGCLALVTDAGTPIVSDPGGRLVAAVAEAGHEIEPVPGASAVLAALMACGLRVSTFSFLGFPPRRPGARRKLFRAHAAAQEALVLFESPNRLAGTLVDLAASLGADRPACVARELTKRYEEIVRGTLEDLSEQFAEGARGEVTLVVEGIASTAAALGCEEIDFEAVDRSIEALIASGKRAREISSELAEQTGLKKRDLYARAVAALAAREADESEAAGS